MWNVNSSLKQVCKKCDQACLLQMLFKVVYHLVKVFALTALYTHIGKSIYVESCEPLFTVLSSQLATQVDFFGLLKISSYVRLSPFLPKWEVSQCCCFFSKTLPVALNLFNHLMLLCVSGSLVLRSELKLNCERFWLCKQNANTAFSTGAVMPVVFLLDEIPHYITKLVIWLNKL